jgi:hypothetical protein
MRKQFCIVGIALLALSAIPLFAQDEPDPGDNPLVVNIPSEPQSQPSANLFQRNLVQALRREFPRIPGILTSMHSCKLPDYGRLVFVTVQPPVFYFTRPMLAELNRRQQAAEDAARKMQAQIMRASQFVKLKAREAELLEQINTVTTSKKNSKSEVAELQQSLADVRKSLGSMEDSNSTNVPVAAPTLVSPSMELMNDVDLDRMLRVNYQQLTDKLTDVMRNALAENASSLTDLNTNERICITTHVRQSLTGSDETILFILTGSDIEAYRNGQLDLDALKKKVLIQREQEN